MRPQNLLQIFRETVTTRQNAPCLRFKEKNQWHTLNWNECFTKVLELASGLKKFGLKKGDRVCIFSKTRYEWTLADLAILSCGGITVPIYESSTAEQAAYILENSDARVVFVEDDIQLNKVSTLGTSLSELKQIIVFESSKKTKGEGVYTLDQLFLWGAKSGEAVFNEMSENLTFDDEASYVYTSGTTGPPKGAILTHGNFVTELEALVKALTFTIKSELLLFLPLAHILARVVQFAHLKQGFVVCYAESIDKILDNIQEVKPHILPSVPRIFEKVHTRVMQNVETFSSTKQKFFQWALKIGSQRALQRLRCRLVPPLLQVQWLIADQLVFSKLRTKMGGRIDYFISGGAPLSREIAEFFFAAGFTILEGYGLTETTAAVSINQRNEIKLGTVGKILDGIEVKIADDGEILVRGGVIFKGYYRRPQETRDAIDAEGWFHTGDIGELDHEGFLKITDRKKDIIITAAGKNVAPQNIENLIKTDPFISQVVIHGDRRKFLSALVTLNKDQVIHYAKEHRIPFADYAELVKNEKIYHLIKARIEEKNKQLAKYESIKKFAILENDFSVENGELTPTMKVKRKFTSEKYKNIFDQFYQE